MTYTQEQNPTDFTEISKQLLRKLDLQDVQKSTWNKVQDLTSTPLLLTFKEKYPLRCIDIPEEWTNTKVYEYNENVS